MEREKNIIIFFFNFYSCKNRILHVKVMADIR